METPPIAPLPEEPRKSNTTLIIVAVALVLCCCCLISIPIGRWLWENGDRLFGTGTIILQALV